MKRIWTIIGVREVPRAWILSALVLCGFAGVAYWRVAGPANAPYDLDDCQRAYARARNATDTLNVDRHPFPGWDKHATRTCGALRGLSRDTSQAPPLFSR